MKIKALALLLVFFLAACARNAPPSTIYALHGKEGRKGVVAVSISEPDVPAGFDSNRIALYLDGGRRLDYYAGAVWPDRLAKVLQEVIIQSASGVRAAAPGSGMPAPYTLLVKVKDFAPVYAAGPDHPPTLRVSLNYRFLSPDASGMLLDVTFSEEAPAAANTRTQVVSGLETLLQRVNARAFKKVAAAVH